MPPQNPPQQYIKLPDGSYAAFPSGMSDQQIQGVLSKHFAAQPPAQAPAAQPAQPAQPSALTRFVQNYSGAVGAPSQVSDIWKGPAFMALHPIESAKLLGGAIDQSMKDTYAQGQSRVQQGDKLGGYYEEGLAHVPVLGPMLAQAGEQTAAKDYAGGLGTTAGLATGLLMDKAVPHGEEFHPAALPSRVPQAAPDISPIIEELKKFTPKQEEAQSAPAPKPAELSMDELRAKRDRLVQQVEAQRAARAPAKVAAPPVEIHDETPRTVETPTATPNPAVEAPTAQPSMEQLKARVAELEAQKAAREQGGISLNRTADWYKYPYRDVAQAFMSYVRGQGGTFASKYGPETFGKDYGEPVHQASFDALAKFKNAYVSSVEAAINRGETPRFENYSPVEKLSDTLKKESSRRLALPNAIDKELYAVKEIQPNQQYELLNKLTGDLSTHPSLTEATKVGDEFQAPPYGYTRPAQLTEAAKPALEAARRSAKPEPQPAPTDLPKEIYDALDRGNFHAAQSNNPELSAEAREGHAKELSKLGIASKFNEFARNLTPENRAALAGTLKDRATRTQAQSDMIAEAAERLEKNGALNSTLNDLKSRGGETVRPRENPETGEMEAAGGHMPYDAGRWSRALMAELTGREERLGQGVDDIVAKGAPKVGNPEEWPKALEFARNMRDQMKQDIRESFERLRDTQSEEDAARLQEQLEEFDNHTNQFFEPKVHEGGVGNRAFKEAGPNGEPAAEFQPVTLDQARRMFGSKLNKIPAKEEFLARSRELGTRAKQLGVFADSLLSRNKQAGFATPALFGADVIADVSAKIGTEVADIAKSAGSTTKQAVDSIADLLIPTHGVGRETLDALATMQGDIDKMNYLAKATLRQYEQHFDSLADPERIEFINKFMHGEQQPTPELQAIADTIRKIDSADADAIEATRGADNFNRIEDHFRLLYKKLPGRTDEGFRNWIAARKPLQGTKGFLRQRVFGDLTEAMDAGGVPVTTNPVTMFRMAHADVLRYLHTQKLWDWAKDSGARVFVKNGEKIPDGFVRLHDRIAKTYFPAKSGEGMVSPGEWYVEEGFGRLLNNYLSKDYIRANVLGKTALDLKNLSVGYSLFGPYHAVRMALTSIGTDMFASANKAYTGFRMSKPDMVLDGLRDFIKSAGAPVSQFREGGAALKYLENKRAFLSSDAGKAFARQYPGTDALLDDLAHSGLRLERHPDYTVPIVDNMMSDFRNGKYIHGAMRAPGAMLYRGMQPLFDSYIPRLKIGAFMRDMSNALTERADDIASGKVTRTELARQTGNRIDNTFGELNLDRLFWNKTFKSLMQLDYTAASWRLGKALLMKDAIADQFRAVRESLPKLRAAQSAADYRAALPRMSNSLGYVLGDLAVTGLTSAVIMKMFAHKDPQSAKDLIHPQIGGVDAHGKPLRVTLPTMAGHELESAIRNPASFVTGGQTEVMTRLMEDMRNQDFFGKQVRNPDDPAYKQFEELMFHLVPDNIAMNNMQRLAQAGATKSQAPLALFGATPASKRLDMSPAEREAQDRAARYYTKGPTTQTEWDKRQLRTNIVIALRNGNRQLAQQMYAQGRKDGSIGPKEGRTLQERATEPYLKQLISEPGITIQDLAQIASKATPAEKQIMYPIVAKRFKELSKMPPAQADALRTQIRKEFGVAAP